MAIKRMTIQYISILKMNMTEEESLEFRLRKIDETIYYLLDKINHNDLMSEKYKSIFQVMNLKLLKLLTNFYWLETNARIVFKTVRIYL